MHLLPGTEMYPSPSLSKQRNASLISISKSSSYMSLKKEEYFFIDVSSWLLLFREPDKLIEGDYSITILIYDAHQLLHQGLLPRNLYSLTQSHLDFSVWCLPSEVCHDLRRSFNFSDCFVSWVIWPGPGRQLWWCRHRRYQTVWTPPGKDLITSQLSFLAGGYVENCIIVNTSCELDDVWWWLLVILELSLWQTLSGLQFKYLRVRKFWDLRWNISVQCPTYCLDLLISQILFLNLNMSIIKFVNMVWMLQILNYQLADLHAFIIGLELDLDIVTSWWGMDSGCPCGSFLLLSYRSEDQCYTACCGLIIQNEDIMMG